MRFIHIIAAIAMTAAAFLPVRAADDIAANYEFAETTPLASGRWVKVSVTGSGVYEITYEQLAEMGFANPDRVAIYGLGGAKRSRNFLDTDGSRLVEDAVQPVPLAKGDGKLIFYAQGDRKLVYSNLVLSSKTLPRFSRESLNTSSEKTCYLLTDSHPRALVQPAQAVDKQKALEAAEGYACAYHEEETYNGYYNSGEQWVGENVNRSTPLTYQVSAPHCVPGTTVAYYFDILVPNEKSGTLTVSFNGSKSNWALTKPMNQTYTWYSAAAANQFNVDDSHLGTAEFNFTVTDDFDSNLWIDYWTAVYATDFSYLDTDPDYTQFEAGFMGNGVAPWHHAAPAGSKLWDITDPLHPEELEVADGRFYSGAIGASKVVAFNPAAQLRRLDPGFEEIPNQDLHALQHQPCDMLIITVPSLRVYADKIAALHKELDGQEVVVVNHRDLFNEFNAGTPDPICYRMMAKMLYQHPDRRLKNVLFLGPLQYDYRNIAGIENRIDGMIAFQDQFADLSNIPGIAMDYYGIMADNIGTTMIEAAPITLGVGVLPIESEYEGEAVVNKIRRHLERDDFSSTVNETYSMGCGGDGHIHEKQAIELGQLIQDLARATGNSKFSHETLWMDGIGGSMVNDRVMMALNRGKALLVYFGHSGATGFGGLQMTDVVNAQNKEMGLGFFGGCDLSHPDHGSHGIGDISVTRAKNGFIGVIGSTRTVMSNHNESLGRNVVNSMFYDENNKPRTVTPTMGEVYARAKDRTQNNSEVCYLLVGDPALRVPTALTEVKLELPARGHRGGELVQVKGTVVDAQGNPRTDYNGYATVKLMEPPRMVVTPEITGETKMPDYEINDLPLLRVKAKVTDGTFTANIPLPADIDTFLPAEGAEASLPVLAGTWDPAMKLGGSGIAAVTLAEYGSESDGQEARDTEAPVVTLSFDPEFCRLDVEAIDNSAMMPGIGNSGAVSLSIDGKSVTAGHKESEDVAVSFYNGSVDAFSLGTGKHTAVATARDLAGNISKTATLSFEIADLFGLVLSTPDKYAVDSIGFEVNGNYDGALNLLVTHPDGTVAANVEMDGKKHTLDTTQLPAGHYRAAVRSDSHLGAKVNSNIVEFIVID